MSSIASDVFLNSTLAFGLGTPADIGIIGGVIVLLFGGAKIAGFGKSLGMGIKEFKKEVRDDNEPVSVSPPPAVLPGFAEASVNKPTTTQESVTPTPAKRRKSVSKYKPE